MISGIPVWVFGGRALNGATPGVPVGRGWQVAFGRGASSRPPTVVMGRPDGSSTDYVSRRAGRVVCTERGECRLYVDSVTHGLVVRRFGRGASADLRMGSGTAMSLSAGLWLVRNGPPRSDEPDKYTAYKVGWIVIEVPPATGAGVSSCPNPAAATGSTVGVEHSTFELHRSAAGWELTAAEVDAVLAYFAEYVALDPPRLRPQTRAGHQAATATGTRQHDGLRRARERAGRHGYSGEADQELLAWLLDEKVVTPALVRQRLATRRFGV